MRGYELARAIVVGLALGIVADGWQSLVASGLLIIAFILTDMARERDAR